MQLSSFNYNLPKELIAQTPLQKRDESRLLILKDKIEHKKFYEIIDYFNEGDTIVLNNTKVIPAKLKAKKETEGKIEVLLIAKKENLTNDKNNFAKFQNLQKTMSSSNLWECLIKGKIKEENTLFFKNNLKAIVREKLSSGRFIIEFERNIENELSKYGEMPLPPYIKQELKEQNRYQTIFAKYDGSIASPTAGLHFTENLVEKIKARGVNFACLTLHVGVGTFLPIKTENIEQHKMEKEYFIVGKNTADIINKTIEKNKKLFAVGTTTVRTLESCTEDKVKAKSGFAEIFIYPSYKFKCPIYALITNFHLPKSTNLMLVCAFGGKERILSAYQTAIKEKYRFYSFGDGMMIFK